MYGPNNCGFRHKQYFQSRHQYQSNVSSYSGRGHYRGFGANNPRNNRDTSAYNFNNEFWCETCDRGFKTQTILDNHKKEHQKCNIDGCQFVGHPKVITKHIQMQHSTGLYKKIANLNNPEEIEKWREERRKKYPTKSNIEKKKSEIQEKLDRGEKMGMKSLQKRDKNQNKNYNKDNHSQKNRVLKRSSNKNNSKHLPPKKIIKLESDSLERSIKPFSGIQQLMEDSEDDIMLQEPSTELIEDDDFTEDIKNNEVLQEKPAICGALVSLINDYGFSDEEDVVNEKNLKAKETVKQSNSPKNINKNDLVKITDYKEPDEDSGPEEIKVNKKVDICDSIQGVTETNIKNNLHSKKCKEKKPKKRVNHNLNRRKIPSTLLEKLLSNEIKKERNTILQCIRHIVKNNFFETEIKRHT